MHGVLRGSPNASSDADGRCAGEKIIDVKSDVIDLGWFVGMVRVLHPNKPGAALHDLTGYDERLCQKYAAGSVKPSAYFLRNLIRSKQGWQHLVAIMDDCEAEWWRELVILKECAAAYETRRQEITKRD